MAGTLETGGYQTEGTAEFFESYDRIVYWIGEAGPVSLVVTDGGTLDLSDELTTTTWGRHVIESWEAIDLTTGGTNDLIYGSIYGDTVRAGDGGHPLRPRAGQPLRRSR